MGSDRHNRESRKKHKKDGKKYNKKKRKSTLDYMVENRIDETTKIQPKPRVKVKMQWPNEMKAVLLSEFLSSLEDLQYNNRAQIIFLTSLADENAELAPDIVETIVDHLYNVDSSIKLTVLYLIDSIVKTYTILYLPLFSKHIVNVFLHVFENTDASTRKKLLTLRDTWTTVFHPDLMAILDKKVQLLDSSWPVINPNAEQLEFIKKRTSPSPDNTETRVITPQAPTKETNRKDLLKVVEQKAKELLEVENKIRSQQPIDFHSKKYQLAEVQRQKVQLELFRAKVQLEHHRRQLDPELAATLPDDVSFEPSLELSSPVLNTFNEKSKRAEYVPTKIGRSESSMLAKPTTSSHINSAPSTSKRSIISQLPLPETVNLNETQTSITSLKFGKTKTRDLLSKKPETATEGHDLDLRILAAPLNKRQSPSEVNPAAKKSRTEDFQPLFGTKDVDLRLNANSSVPLLATTLVQQKESTMSKQESSISHNDPTVQQKQIVFENSRQATIKQQEKRNVRNEASAEIIMQQASEQLKNGIITDAEYSQILRNIIQYSEFTKLKAAQRKDKADGMSVWQSRNSNSPPVDSTAPSFMQRSHFQQQFQKSVPRSNNENQWLSSNSATLNGTHQWQTQWQQSQQPWGQQQQYGTPSMEIWQSTPGFGYRPMINDIPPPPQPPIIPLLASIPPPPMPPMAIPPPPIPPMHIPALGVLIANGPEAITIPSVIGSSNSKQWKVKASVNSNIYNEFQNSRGVLPSADPKLLADIRKDPMRSINIGGILREIRFYGSIGVVFVGWDDPRDIGFQDGYRTIYIEDIPIRCKFNEDYQEFTFEGEIHRVKLGTPTRELYIDDKWYECAFGGSSIIVELGDRKVRARLEGPIPSVKIGNVKRTDIVLGKINLIVNATNAIPVFLDAKPQIIEISGDQCTLEFADSLLTALLNGMAIPLEFGGLPKPIIINNKKNFIRFSSLPQGFKAGYVKMKCMRGSQPQDQPQISMPYATSLGIPQNLPVIPMQPARKLYPKVTLQPTKAGLPINDVSSASGPLPKPTQTNTTTQNETKVQTVAPAPASPSLNVNELLEKLIEAGIIKPDAKKTEETKEEKMKEEVSRVGFDNPESLKSKPGALVAYIYHGMQCGSCSLRFTAEEAIHYSRHLDWHFRQNRRQRNMAKSRQLRNWYHKIGDWMQYEEVIDYDEQNKTWFDLEKESSDGGKTDSDSEESVQPSVPSGVDEQSVCPICLETFEQFFNDEADEWQLKKAVTFENKNYHPGCLKDHKERLGLEQKEKEEKEGKEGKETADLSTIQEEEGETKEDERMEEEVQVEQEEVQMEQEEIVQPKSIEIVNLESEEEEKEIEGETKEEEEESKQTENDKSNDSKKEDENEQKEILVKSVEFQSEDQIEPLEIVESVETEEETNDNFESVDLDQEYNENFEAVDVEHEENNQMEHADESPIDSDSSEEEIRIKIERPSSDEEGTVELKVLESNVPIEYDSEADEVQQLEVESKNINFAEISDSENEDDPYVLAEKDKRRIQLEELKKKQKENSKIPPDQLLVFENVKVKEEPVEETPVISMTNLAKADTTKVSVKSNIDGNTDLDKNVSVVPKNTKIKINITKPIKQVSKKEVRSKIVLEPKSTARAVPLLPAAIKPTLQRKKLQIMPTVHRGEELSSLCSVM